MSRNWQPLRPGRFDRRADRAGADPMWIWADATAYRDIGHRDTRHAPKVWCVLERAGRIVSELRDAADAGLPDDAELAMPVIPERMRAPPVATDIAEGRIEPGTADRPLIGVIDSGCPFAATWLRDAGGQHTRVLALWDQDDAPAFEGPGFRPPGFGYGRAVTRRGLNDYMKAARGIGGRVDEALCYRLAGYDRVTRHFSHGAAVLSQLMAPPLQQDPPQPRPGPARIDEADLVFVDIPRAGLQDASSAAIARYMLDGLRFILAHAVAGQHVVVNISTGSSRTSHDGRSLTERLLQQAVDDAQRQGIRLHIVLPAGNGNMEQRHAVLSSDGAGLTLFVPPGCETPQYVTVRWPAGSDGAQLRITSPAGESCELGIGQALGLFGPQGLPCAGAISPLAAPGRQARSLLAFAPTHSFDPETPLAPSGRWQIGLVLPQGAGRLKEPVRFWVSRNQVNPGAKERCRQADFVDVGRRHHPLAWGRLSEDDPAGHPVADGIRHDGAVTGLATAAGAAGGSIVVIGSRYANSGLPSRYSARATGPDELPHASCIGDMSRALPGVTVHGNHGGEMVRVVGTSFAAPLAARGLVNGG